MAENSKKQANGPIVDLLNHDLNQPNWLSGVKAAQKPAKVDRKAVREAVQERDRKRRAEKRSSREGAK